jgi:hypothetical protein
MRNMRRASAIGVSVLLAACTLPLRTSAPGEDIELAVEAASAPDSITLVLRNESSEEVGYNLCPSTLEQRVGAGWQAVLDERVCTMELRLLPSGREGRYTVGLPAGLASGEYRYRAAVTRMESGAPVGLTSDVFQVAR